MALDLHTGKEKIEVVEDSNESILSSIENYLAYIRQTIKQIIIDDELQYSEPMDTKKIYPAFTYTQFLYLLSRVNDRVYSINKELLYNNNNIYVYDVLKVKKAYSVYSKLCQYYGFTCAVEPFYSMTGIEKNTLVEWLSCGRSDLYKTMQENAKNTVISRFENSPVPLLQLAAANHKYRLAEPVKERTEAAAVDVLPDLLALSDTKKALPDNSQQGESPTGSAAKTAESLI